MPAPALTCFLPRVLLPGILPAMSIATLQQFGQSLPSWLALVQRGETVAIMDGGHEVARFPGEHSLALGTPGLNDESPVGFGGTTEVVGWLIC